MTHNLITMSTLIRTFQRPYEWCEVQLEACGIKPAMQIDQARYFDASTIDLIREHVAKQKIADAEREIAEAQARRKTNV